MFMDRFFVSKKLDQIDPAFDYSFILIGILGLLGYWGSNPNIQEPESCALPIWLYPSKSPVRELNS